MPAETEPEMTCFPSQTGAGAKVKKIWLVVLFFAGVAHA